VSSNAKTATSISDMTRESSAVASSAPRRCSRQRYRSSAFTSSRTSPSGSSRAAPRARIEKSSSRMRGEEVRDRLQRANHAFPQRRVKAEPRADDEHARASSGTFEE
jgi:hypothetical protein